jgi:hypothetical protein
MVWAICRCSRRVGRVFWAKDLIEESLALEASFSNSETSF